MQEVVEIVRVMMDGIAMPFKLVGGITTHSIEIIQAFMKQLKFMDERREANLTNQTKGITSFYNLKTRSNGQITILNIPKEMVEDGKPDLTGSTLDRYAKNNGVLCSVLYDFNTDDDFKQIAIDSNDAGMWRPFIAECTNRFHEKNRAVSEQTKIKADQLYKKAAESKERAAFYYERGDKEKAVAFDKEASEYTAAADELNALSKAQADQETKVEIDIEDYYKNSEGGAVNIDNNLKEVEAGLPQHGEISIEEAMKLDTVESNNPGDVVYIYDPLNPNNYIKGTCSEAKNPITDRTYNKMDYESVEKSFSPDGSVNVKSKGFVSDERDSFDWEAKREAFLHTAGFKPEEKVVVEKSEDVLSKKQEIFEETKKNKMNESLRDIMPKDNVIDFAKAAHKNDMDNITTKIEFDNACVVGQDALSIEVVTDINKDSYETMKLPRSSINEPGVYRMFGNEFLEKTKYDAEGKVMQVEQKNFSIEESKQQLERTRSLLKEQIERVAAKMKEKNNIGKTKKL
ncbi:MAG: hypothetical protein E7242_01025 [Lachnospiraceae bacterium]|nr:hypothetical protein [Lachnospiraceae bacterium]